VNAQFETWVVAAAAVGIFGILIGSFANVVIYRVPAGVSIATPPSACPHCGNRIKPYDNIPVISWLLLGGKCRTCAEPISKRYPLVELTTGVAFAAVAAWWLVQGGAWTGPAESLRPQASDPLTAAIVGILVLIAFLYLAAISVILAIIDLDTHTLPNRIVLPSYLVVIVFFVAAAAVGGDWPALLRAGSGLVGLWLIYAILAFAYPGGMGFGDVKLAGVLGAYLGWLGWGSLLVGAFAAFLLGGLFALALVASRRANRKSGIPFGPWMLLGAWVGIFLGEPIWRGYLATFGLA